MSEVDDDILWAVRHMLIALDERATASTSDYDNDKFPQDGDFLRDLFACDMATFKNESMSRAIDWVFNGETPHHPNIAHHFAS